MDIGDHEFPSWNTSFLFRTRLETAQGPDKELAVGNPNLRFGEIPYRGGKETKGYVVIRKRRRLPNKVGKGRRVS